MVHCVYTSESITHHPIHHKGLKLVLQGYGWRCSSIRAEDVPPLSSAPFFSIPNTCTFLCTSSKLLFPYGRSGVLPSRAAPCVSISTGLAAPFRGCFVSFAGRLITPRSRKGQCLISFSLHGRGSRRDEWRRVRNSKGTGRFRRQTADPDIACTCTLPRNRCWSFVGSFPSASRFHGYSAAFFCDRG